MTDALPRPTARLALRRWYRAVCGVPFRWQALAAVAVPGLAAVASPAPAHAVLAVVLGVAAATDLLWKRIPNVLPAAGVGWAVALSLLAPTGPAPADVAAGLFACFGLMLALYLVFRGGEGDVKLMAAVGALAGPWHGVEAVLFGYMLAAVVALPLLAAGRRGTLPMAPFFAAGLFASLAA